MKALGRLLAGLACIVAFAGFLPPASAAVRPDWPPVTRTARPWTYWWWMGSAVEPEELRKNLDLLSGAGLGGVHIIPIYGAIGWEDRYVDFLSPRWMEIFARTVDEAGRRDMGVDLTTGTGWPFGGPQVAPADAAKAFTVTLGPTGWGVSVRGTGQKVKRAAPGGEGPVLDYFSADALHRYLAHFDDAFASTSTSARPRAFYNDSYEVYGADWTPRMFEEFSARRGYDLRDHLAALAGIGRRDRVARVLCDYRETVSDLLLENFTRPWAAWAHRQGAITRDQAHGSPANLLDLYASADIPETEAFGASRFPIPGLRYYRPLPAGEGRPNPLAMRFASSAAHLAGRPLVSSESCTWLGEHFTVTLAQVKPELDRLWLSGVNHVFFHGIAYSPTTEPWPGWLFYASTHFGPTDTMFRDLPALTAYIARVQSFLQAGAPDNDVLLYWPVHDLWSGVYDRNPESALAAWLSGALRPLSRGHFQEFREGVKNAVEDWFDSRRSHVQLFTMHNPEHWLEPTAFGRAAQTLAARGYAFDYVSDRGVAGLDLRGPDFNRGIVTPAGAHYRAIVVPSVRFIPVGTMEKLVELARAGARVIFLDHLPADVPGRNDLAARRERLRRAASALQATALIGPDLEPLLASAGVRREPLVDQGLSFVRRAHDHGHTYFIAAQGSSGVDGWVTIASPAASAVIFDPLSGRSGLARREADGSGSARVWLQLEPGQSLVLQTFDAEAVEAPAWDYLAPAGEPIELTGEWRVEAVAGGPTLPPAFAVRGLRSWTEQPGDAWRSFSGTARYATGFDAPSGGDWLLDLGDVRESARVFLNGEEKGVVFCAPFRLRLTGVRPGANTLAVEVTNLPVNRIIALDRQGVEWRRFHNANVVDMNGRQFNAADWPPFPSGLLGPVRLRPLPATASSPSAPSRTSP